MATDAIPGYKDVGLPTLLVYKAGEMVTNALRVTDALPPRFSDLDVAKMLQVKGILTLPTGEDSELAKRDRATKELEKRRAEMLTSAVDDWDIEEDEDDDDDDK